MSEAVSSKTIRREKKILVDHFFSRFWSTSSKSTQRKGIKKRPLENTGKEFSFKGKSGAFARSHRSNRARARLVLDANRRRREKKNALPFRSLLLSSERATPTRRKSTFPDRFSSSLSPDRLINSGRKEGKRKERGGGRDGKRKTKKSKKSFRRAPSRPRRGSWSVLRSVRTA